MSNEGLLMTLGIMIAISPFVGVPSSWLSLIVPLLGVAAAATAFLMLRARKGALPPAALHEAPTSSA